MVCIGVSSRRVRSYRGTLCWGRSDGWTFCWEGAVNSFEDEPVWVTGPSMLVAPDLAPDLLWRGTGGNFFGNTGGNDGAFDDPSPSLVFRGIVFVSFVQLFPTDCAKL